MTGRLLKAAQESRPRFVQRLEEELNIPLFPELRQTLLQLDDVQAQQVALKLRQDMLKEQARLTGSREVTDVARQFTKRETQLQGRQLQSERLRAEQKTAVARTFGLHKESLKTQHEEQLRNLTQNFESWIQDAQFKRRFGIAGGVSVAIMLFEWNLIANALRSVMPGSRIENF